MQLSHKVAQRREGGRLTSECSCKQRGDWQQGEQTNMLSRPMQQQT